MDALDIIAAVQRWQANPSCEPLVCQRDGRHGRLEAVDRDGSVILRCPNCKYAQVIPDAVLRERAG